MVRRFLLIAVSATALLGGFTAQADAQRDRGPWGPPSVGSHWSPDDARNAVREGRHRPLRELLRSVEAQYPGQLIGVSGLEERGDGRAVYRLRWRTHDGRLLDLAVDAESGALTR